MRLRISEGPLYKSFDWKVECLQLYCGRLELQIRVRRAKTAHTVRNLYSYSQCWFSGCGSSSSHTAISLASS